MTGLTSAHARDFTPSGWMPSQVKQLQADLKRGLDEAENEEDEAELLRAKTTLQVTSLGQTLYSGLCCVFYADACIAHEYRKRG